MKLLDQKICTLKFWSITIKSKSTCPWPHTERKHFQSCGSHWRFYSDRLLLSLHRGDHSSEGLFSGSLSLIFWQSCVPWRILVPWPRIEPEPPCSGSVESWPLDHEVSHSAEVLHVHDSCALPYSLRRQIFKQYTILL